MPAQTGERSGGGAVHQLETGDAKIVDGTPIECAYLFDGIKIAVMLGGWHRRIIGSD
ncbi:hypothetical protein GCM10010872_37380 [Dyella flava]|nr:hypothetical protein GCM10010872_37380 [Dyella flava]